MKEKQEREEDKKEAKRDGGRKKRARRWLWSKMRWKRKEEDKNKTGMKSVRGEEYEAEMRRGK